jgi:hypothetical protein
MPADTFTMSDKFRTDRQYFASVNAANMYGRGWLDASRTFGLRDVSRAASGY